MSEIPTGSNEDEPGGADAPSGPLFDLLTDALRSGPGSQPWAEALSRLSASAEMDGYTLLLSARQRLESGKSFRAVESGAGLTQAILAGVAAQAESERREAMRIQPRARTIAALAAAAALVIFSIVGIIWEVMLYGGDAENQRVELSMQRPDRLLGYQNFESIIPVGWHPIGSLSVKADRGLRLTGGDKQIEQSGGLLRMEPLPSDRPFEVDANIRYMGGASVAPELFVTDNPNLDGDRLVDAGHEFVWTVLHDRPAVRLPNQTFQTDSEFLELGVTSTFGVKIKMSGASAAVQASFGNHKCSLWNGTHLLAADKPWRVGVRFVVMGDKHDDCVALESIRVTSH